MVEPTPASKHDRAVRPSPDPLDPARALRAFLEALGVPAERVPADLPGRPGLYRSLLAGRRMLIVLDDARDAGQVRPLPPGSSACLVLVTGRGEPTDLVVVEGAELLALPPLSTAEARELLERRLGARYLAHHGLEVTRLVSHSAGLPSALNVAAARAVRHPELPLERRGASARNGPHRSVRT